MRLLQRAYRGWFMNPIFTVIVLALLVIGCGGVHPPQPPHPPVPTPTPTPHSTLTALSDGTWTRDGKPFTWRQTIVCCKGYPDDDPRDLAKSQNWPLTSFEFIQWISFHKENATHVRNWMNPEDERGDLFSPYFVMPDMKVDLTKWNDKFWNYKRDLLIFAREHDVIIEEDIIDTWAHQHGQAPTCRAHNINGEDICGLGSMTGPLPRRVADFVAKLVQETCHFNNVTYQDGNESWKGMSEQWSLDILATVRAIEQQQGCARHPFGTASGSDAVRRKSDYVTVEQESAAQLWCYQDRGQPKVCKPTHVNETAPLPIKDIIRQTYLAQSKGTAFAFWMGENNQDQRGQGLIYRQGWTEGKSNPFPVADECPKVAGIGARVLQFVCNNQTVPEPCVHGNAIIDATPHFGVDRDPGGVCNGEHDHCDGRICEPPDGLTWVWRIDNPRGVNIGVQNTGECGARCPDIPCKSNKGYQLKFENLTSGCYEATPTISSGVDCEGHTLLPREVTGQTVRFCVP